MTREEWYQEQMDRLRAELRDAQRQLDVVIRLLGREIEKRKVLSNGNADSETRKNY